MQGFDGIDQPHEPDHRLERWNFGLPKLMIQGRPGNMFDDGNHHVGGERLRHRIGLRLPDQVHHGSQVQVRHANRSIEITLVSFRNGDGHTIRATYCIDD
jgi:hypothetical protein